LKTTQMGKIKAYLKRNRSFCIIRQDPIVENTKNVGITRR